MKGQEEIITIILLVMIVLAVASLAYMWITGMFTSLVDFVGNAITQTSGSMATQFRLENAVYDPILNELYVTVRNVGSQNFDSTRTAFYVNDVPQQPEDALTTCPTCDCFSLDRGCIVNYVIVPSSVPPEKSMIRITIETGAQDAREIKILTPPP